MALLRSLRARVVLWISVALSVLFAITIVGLDIAFSRTIDRAVEGLLQSQLLGLIALAEPDATGELSVPADAITLFLGTSAADGDEQLSLAGSGFFGVLLDAEGYPVWQSQSLFDWSVDLTELPPAGAQRRFRIDPPDLPPLAVLVYGINWEFGSGRLVPYTIGVAVSLEPYRERQLAFRRNLIGWFVGMLVVMLAVVTALLAFVLRPLDRLERQVREVENGARMAIDAEQPSELAGLAGSLNALIETERRRLVRYRNTLDDLAHSLKTPLAAMRSLLGARRAQRDDDEPLEREIDRMEQRVSYQLRRARASGATGIGLEPVELAPILSDLRDTLDKVYRDKHVRCRLAVAPGAVFRGDAGDVTELLGNLLENAYKYCRRRVTVVVEMLRGRLVIKIGDDGPGIAPERRAELLERGARADESVPGQGIGLAVVRETVELYNGRLEIGESSLGGAELRIELARAGRAP